MTETSGNYTVLARRYRPQSFGEVIGQEHVARALQNAIQADRVAHAYLFTGARGVGKTSTARILAKTLNCPNSKDGVPCNECDICIGISEGRDVDTLEIDGASNRGIDDIRSLRANVNVKSMRTKYKIYIIDEVHMLTKEAFNALLKTLEEPPPGVKFVFCTTEPQKLPDTILSRCQRFDFSTIETENITDRLQQIAEAEGFEVTEDAVELVARRAGGSMRDSQSLFDQLLAFGGEKIEASDVHRLLGTADDERLVTIASALVNRQQKEVLESVESAMTAGVQLSEFVDQLVNYLRDLMVLAANANEVPLLSVSRSYRDQLQEQANQWGLRTILAALQILAETKSKMFRASHARSLVELALIRLTTLGELQQLDQMIELLNKGEFRVTTPTNSETAPVPTNVPVAAEPAAPRMAEPVQKKSPEPAKIVPETVSEEAPVPESTVTSLVFEKGNEEEIYAQLLECKEVSSLTQLRQTKGIAITGPNQVEILYPANYDLLKQLLSRPENSALIQSALKNLTGETIRVEFKPVSSGSENSGQREEETPQPKRPALTQVKVEEQDITDEYVQNAVRIFGSVSIVQHKIPDQS